MGNLVVMTLVAKEMAPCWGSRLSLAVSGECRRRRKTAKKMSADYLIQIGSHDSLTRWMVSHLLQMEVFSLGSQEMTDMMSAG